MPEELFYIQNIGFQGNCLIWWKKDGHGYTCDLDKAWKVTEERANEICRMRSGEDVKWPASFIDKTSSRHVNTEDLRRAIAARDRSTVHA